MTPTYSAAPISRSEILLDLVERGEDPTATSVHRVHYELTGHETRTDLSRPEAIHFAVSVGLLAVKVSDGFARHPIRDNWQMDPAVQPSLDALEELAKLDFDRAVRLWDGFADTTHRPAFVDPGYREQTRALKDMTAALDGTFWIPSWSPRLQALLDEREKLCADWLNRCEGALDSEATDTARFRYVAFPSAQRLASEPPVVATRFYEYIRLLDVAQQCWNRSNDATFQDYRDSAGVPLIQMLQRDHGESLRAIERFLQDTGVSQPASDHAAIGWQRESAPTASSATKATPNSHVRPSTLYIDPYREALHNGPREHVSVTISTTALRSLLGTLARGVPMQGTDCEALAEQHRRIYMAHAFVHDLYQQVHQQVPAPAPKSKSESPSFDA